MRCPACERDNAPDASYCSQCGRPLARPCPNCGPAAPADALFCAGCGCRLDDGRPAEGRAPPPPPAHLAAGRGADALGPLQDALGLMRDRHVGRFEEASLLAFAWSPCLGREEAWLVGESA